MDLTGRRFGKLIALEPTEHRHNGSVVWFCKCDCGNHILVGSSRLTHNKTQHCGCYSAASNSDNDVLSILDDYDRNVRGGWRNKKWKDAVKARDKYECQKCGATSDLVVHHIFSYKNNWDKRYKIDNGIVLCSNCHIIFHKTFGFRRNTDAQLALFLME